jgi:serine/threonine protein kinase
VIWKKNKVTQMKNERDVLASGLTGWMVQLAYSFQDPHHCYLAMEYCPGGDLRHLLFNLGYLEEDEARLYMAEMILAVHALHQLGYIHRDLKPDNFLIDSTGHLKLTDFGLSKDGLHSNVSTRKAGSTLNGVSSLPDVHSLSRPDTTPQHGQKQRQSMINPKVIATPLYEGNTIQSSSKQSTTSSGAPPVNAATLAFSVVGSPNYMSPEVLSGEHGYGAEVDWWSLGCIFFEMVVGNPPFIGDTPQQVFDAILDWKRTLPLSIEEYKDSMSSDCLNFIMNFLCEPKERFSSKIGLKSIFSHPFFQGFSVDNIFDMEPPFVPNLLDECDTSYFESSNTRHDDFDERQAADNVDIPRPESPSEGIRSSSSIVCPQTAPRWLMKRTKHNSSDEDLASNIGFYSPASKIGSYGRFGMGRSRFNPSHTPMRSFQAADTRDIAGFTFQRKRSIQPREKPSILTLNFDDDPTPSHTLHLRSGGSPQSDACVSSPSFFPCTEILTLDIAPKALIFGDEPPSSPTPPPLQ